jgi:hypothetical protein
MLQLEVDNGGFHHYFINSAGCLGYDCLLHLWLVDAHKIRRLLESALKLVNRDSLSPADFQDALHAGTLRWLYDDDSLFESLYHVDGEFFKDEEKLSHLVGRYLRPRIQELAREYS